MTEKVPPPAETADKALTAGLLSFAATVLGALATAHELTWWSLLAAIGAAAGGHQGVYWTRNRPRPNRRQ